MLNLRAINKDWTLFLDRDGVINYEKYEDYIYNYDEFLFYEGVPEAIKYFSERFGRVIIATNQRGIGRGLMTEADLFDIHTKMLRDLEAAGGRIDKIYFCPAVNNDHPDRKPQPGMAWAAQRDFPAIDMPRSIMVGNTLSDMEFGRNAGMHTVFVKTTHPNQTLPFPTIDLAFDTLADFAKALQSA